MMRNFIENQDLSIDTNYQYVKTLMGIENFVDYQIYEIFIGNQDWLSNNIKFWRPRTENGIWKWVLWDTEYGLALFYPDYSIGYPNFNFLHMALTWGGWGSDDYTYLLRNLVENDDFLECLITRFADLLNTELRENAKIISIIDSLQNLIEPDVQKQFDRWGWTINNWNVKTQQIKDFTNERPFYIRQHIIDEFELDTLLTLNLDVQPVGSGRIKVNTVILNEFPWDGIFFTDYQIQLEALPNTGYEFSGWDGLTTDTSFIEFFSYTDTAFIALFQPAQFDTNIVINEFMADNDTTISDPQGDYDDWIELYNSGVNDIDIGGMYITDDINNPTMYQIPDNLPDSTIILPGEFLLLWADDEPEDGILHLGIKLSADGEQIGLFAKDGCTIIDTITYGQQATDVSFGRITDGNPQWIIMENSTPGYSNNQEIKINLTVFLEGPFDTIANIMNTSLNDNGMLPLEQPYNLSPWNYTGTESVASIPNADVVDWVLIELRETSGDASTATSDSIIARQAAFLLNDGSVVGYGCGNGACPIATSITNNLFVVIWHRNHLGIMSANPLIESGGIYSYDFSTSVEQVYGGILGYKEIVQGIWGMVGGDGDADGQVSNPDINDIWLPDAGYTGYYSGDFNLNTQVANPDKNDLWIPNVGIGTQVTDNIHISRFKCMVPK